MLELLKEDLQKDGVFTDSIPEIFIAIVDAIPNQLIPYRMKLTIATSEAMLFASHLRRNIHHWNGSMIPVNAITFSIAASGTGKDSSVNAARKCFKPGYDLIEQKRKDIAQERAITQATLAGKENPHEWNAYREFYVTPNPLFVAPSTTEGFIQHLNDLDDAGIGAGFIYSGEFGAEIHNGGMIVDNIKLLAEVYDEGSKEVKVLKARENQSREIKSLPVSALFVGSQDNIIYDEVTKRIFKREFSTKLARRSFFNYNPQTVEAPTYEDIPKDKRVEYMFQKEMEIEDLAVAERLRVQEYIRELTQVSLMGIGQPLEVDDDVRVMFTKYKRYNEEKAQTIKAQYPISKLVRMHLQWKALKLAGAIALLSGENHITKTHYVQSINYCEMLDKDMILFEQELVKEPYELFVDFMRQNADEGKYSMSLHTLRKLGYIPTSGSVTAKMKELVHLSSSYDKDGVYTTCEEGICFEMIMKTDISGVSYKPVDNSRLLQLVEQGANKDVLDKAKTGVAAQAVDGFAFDEVTFEDLAELLAGHFAYSPFQFKDGVRGKNDQIVSGCKWLYIDVDTSTITDEEAHFMLMDINHHITRTSNKDNAFKFRVLIELDAIVNIPDRQWKWFMQSITESLALTADPLPKSQIAFSYGDEGRTILSVTDANPLEVKEHLIKSAEMEESKPKPTKLSKPQQKALLEDPLETFQYAFEAPNGQGSRNMIRAAHHAVDLGASREDVIALMHQINNYWDYPMPEDRLQATIIAQIERW